MNWRGISGGHLAAKVHILFNLSVRSLLRQLLWQDGCPPECECLMFVTHLFKFSSGKRADQFLLRKLTSLKPMIRLLRCIA